jgi:cytochrome c oxidase subunit II
MKLSLPLFPDQASSVASQVDALYFFLIAISVFFSVLIAGLVIYFAIKYRRRSELDPVPPPPSEGIWLEVAWSAIPLGISMIIFVWGASLYFKIQRPPDDALEIWVVGKQWMWELQHLEGQREINELHIPLGRSVRLKMTSEDVVHDFFVPAFRTKQDVVPGRYTTTWFRPTKTGKYHLFCSQYCGTKHSAMIGWVYVMDPPEYESWLSGGAGEGSLAERGDKLFHDLACANCHHPDGRGRGPSLERLYGTTVDLDNGTKVVADDDYIRESILSPQAKIVKGYQPIMPTFQGLITEDQLLQLIEYVKSTGKKNEKPAPKNAAKKEVRR